MGRNSSSIRFSPRLSYTMVARLSVTWSSRIDPKLSRCGTASPTYCRAEGKLDLLHFLSLVQD